MKKQIPRRITHKKLKGVRSDRKFDYSLDFRRIDFRLNPELYRVGVGEQGVLLVEPYKSEILPWWKFKTPQIAEISARKIYKLFLTYVKAKDFVGMDLSRKFLQMGFTRARRYANHRSGRKYDAHFDVLPNQADLTKAKSAKIFYEYWKRAEANPNYADAKLHWKLAFG